MSTYRLATEADDAAIRRLLRENGMPAWVEMTMEREPSYFAGHNQFGRDWAVIAEEQEQVVGMYSAAVMPVHLNGVQSRVGYLGGLRVDPRHRNRIRQLRGGYESVLRLAPEEVPLWFTVIAAENKPARRLLEAGIAGLPTYYPQGDYITFAISAKSRWRDRRPRLSTEPAGEAPWNWRRATSEDAASIVTFHNEHASSYQYAPVIDGALVKRLPFYIAGNLDAVAALWDQRAFKQIVARRYKSPAAIKLYNAWARLTGRITLPGEGKPLDQTFIAFFACKEPSHELISSLLLHCETPVASIGMHATNPLRDTIERFKPISYPAKLYAVTFNGQPNMRGLPAQPEAALL